MEDVLTISEKIQEQAWEVVKSSQIIEIWESLGFHINVVGSLPMKLMMKNKEIDFYISSDSLVATDSFSAMSILAKNPKIKQIQYNNLLETEIKSVGWHAIYQNDDGLLWELDMLYVPKESPYSQHLNEITNKVIEVLNAETKWAILSIKNEIPNNIKVFGIEIYEAVIQYGVRNYEDFLCWQETQNHVGLNYWLPSKINLY